MPTSSAWDGSGETNVKAPSTTRSEEASTSPQGVTRMSRGPSSTTSPSGPQPQRTEAQANTVAWRGSFKKPSAESDTAGPETRPC